MSRSVDVVHAFVIVTGADVVTGAQGKRRAGFLEGLPAPNHRAAFCDEFQPLAASVLARAAQRAADSRNPCQ
jgi:hypothetical protein